LGRKGWAFTIIGIMLGITVIVFILRSDDLMEAGSLDRKWEETVVEGAGQNKIVQLYVDGVIAQSGGFSSDFSSGSFISQLDQAKDDDSVKAIVIRVNSPGGEVVASDEIHDKIVEVQKAGKPVIISMGAMAASGGYYIAAPADRIFANEATLTGSLGVIFSIPNYQEAADKLGYTQYTITSGKHKDIGSPMRPMTEEERDIFQSLVNESYMQFVEIIAKGREMSKEEVVKIADGRIYSGKQAHRLGLVDEFGSLEDATDYIKEKEGLVNAKIVRYAQPFSFGSLFMGMQAKPSAKQMLQEMLPEISLQPRLLYMYQP
jgi:protease-4